MVFSTVWCFYWLVCVCRQHVLSSKMWCKCDNVVFLICLACNHFWFKFASSAWQLSQPGSQVFGSTCPQPVCELQVPKFLWQPAAVWKCSQCPRSFCCLKSPCQWRRPISIASIGFHRDFVVQDDNKSVGARSNKLLNEQIMK